MNDRKRKSLDVVSDESEVFESRWEQLDASPGDDSERERLLSEIADWLRDCAWQGRFIPLGSADRRAFRSLIEHWSSRLGHHGVPLEGLDSLAEFDPRAGVPLPIESPYPGLDPYMQSRRTSFFGREELIASCVSHLAQAGNHILLIIGASGSGKSSLALAGILPRLGELHQGEWLFGTRVTPGAHPLAALAESVAQAIGRPEHEAEIQRRFAAEPGQALQQLADVCKERPLMLLIDQFEELLTLCRDADEQSAFAQVLCALSDPSATAGGFSCRILLTLRTDHLARFESNAALQPLHRRLVGENNHCYLSAIGFSDIRRAIKEPADQVGLRFVPPELIDRLASQTAGLANGLPLLQFALRRLWDTRPKNERGEPLDLITEEMVQGLPDVERALGTVAEGIFRTFTPSQQRVCERLLQELVVLDENFEEPLRRRRSEAELVAVLQARFPAGDDIGRVIVEFVASGLLRRFGEGPDRQLEVAHEALLRHWEFIYETLTGAEVKGRLHLIKQISREAAEWAGRCRADGYLSLRGERLDRAIGYANDGWLADTVATDYIEACKTLEAEERLKDQRAREERERADAAEKAREEAELRVEHLRNRMWKLGLGVAVVLLAAIFWRLLVVSKEASVQRKVVIAQRLGMYAEGEIARDPQRGLLLAIEAARHGTTSGGTLLPEAERSLRSAVRTSSFLAQIKGYGRTRIQVSEYAPDGSVLATGDSLGGVILRDPRTGVQRKALFAHVDHVKAIAFSPDGQKMASGSSDGRVVIWDIARGAPLHVLTAHVDQVKGLAFSRPDGRLLATASADASVRLWDVVAGTPVQTLYGHVGAVRALAFGRDERQLVTVGDDKRVVVWDAPKGHVLYSREFLSALFDVDLSADGSKLALAGQQGIEIWDMATRSRLLTITGHTNWVYQVRFSRDQRRLTTASYDGTVRVWRLPHTASDTARRAEEVAQFRGGALAYTGVAFSPSGDTVAATSSEGDVTLWNVSRGGELLTLADHETTVAAVAFSPDGRTLMTAGGTDGRVLAWELLSGRRLDGVLFNGMGKLARAMAFSNGGALAVGFDADVLVVQPGMKESQHLDGHSDVVNDLAFSPDGSRLVSASRDETAIVWELPTGKRLHVLSGHTAPVIAVACSPDGKIIATGSRDKTIRLWRVDTGELLGETTREDSYEILDLAFSADGRQLVSGGMDKKVRVWDVATRKQMAELSGHTDVVTAVATYGHYLATGADDGIRLWDLRSNGLLAAFSARRSRGTHSLAFSADGRYLAAGARDGIVRVYLMRGNELVDLATQRVGRGWTEDECKQFLEGKACPRSSYSMLDEAHRSFEKFEFEAGERLLRQAKSALGADAAALSKEVDARVGTAFLWGASFVLADPEQSSALTQGRSPREAALKLLVAAKKKLPDLSLDPQERLRDLLVYGDVRRARELARDGRIEEAVDAFEKARAGGWALPYEPEGVASRLQALAVFSNAWRDLRSGQMSSAEIESHTKRVEEALPRYPKMGPAHRVLAELYSRQQDFADAEKHYLEAAEVESSAEPLVYLAQMMLKPNARKAVTYTQKALERDPGSDEAWLILGHAEHALKHWKEAADAFDQVSPSARFFALAVNSSGAIHFEKLEDDQGAYQRLTRAMERAPDNLSILANYAEFLLASGRNDQAKVAAARAREHPDAQTPEQADIRVAMSFVLFGAELLSGDRKQALGELGEVARHVQAVAEAQGSGWSYEGIRRALARMLVMAPVEQQSSLSSLLKVLDFVENKGQSGTLDEMRGLLSSKTPN